MEIKAIQTFNIIPNLPQKLESLLELAYNIWWAWDHEAIALFRRMDPELWEETYHNPVKMLGHIKQERLEELEKDESFLAHMERVFNHFNEYRTRKRWFEKTYPNASEFLVAYFSMEFGLTESLPIYSGGLGILAGDHLKSSSALGLPLVGVGLLYQEGYFRQYLNVDGWQQEEYPVNDFHTLPVKREYIKENTQCKIVLNFPGRKVYVQVWKIQVGLVPLYLLDTNLPENIPEDRDITAQLYGGDRDMRIRQEIVLGIGGLRALDALGKRPTICHMNEGHSAFLGLERIRMMMKEHNLSFYEAKEAAAAGNIFTTHTPVPAGIDRFDLGMMDRYFKNYYTELGLSREQFMALGQEEPDKNPNEPFCMAVLALNLASKYNGVSKIHGEVSRKMWKSLWPNIPEEEIPITHITNGVHIRSWISHDMAGLLDRYLGPRWMSDTSFAPIWEKVHLIPDEEFWRTHERRRERMIAFLRRILVEKAKKRNASTEEIELYKEVLNPEALTIGFARRFVEYKRANLILKDLDRLAKILNDKNRPVQIIFAGKAHPKDNFGKELIKNIIHIMRKEEFKRHIVFVEDYDICVARYLVQGVDIWLNTPRRLLEASGTSGMKAAIGGAINMSILDGWWVEGYNINNGWAIGKGEMYEDRDYQDLVESNAIYDLLEKEVIPMFYKRGHDGLPREFIAKMKASVSSICPIYNTHRMVSEYVQNLYFPAYERYMKLTANNLEKAKYLLRWKQYIKENWNFIKIYEIESNGTQVHKVGSTIDIKAKIDLGKIAPDDVLVQAYFGIIDYKGNIANPETINLTCDLSSKSHFGYYIFKGSILCKSSGLYGFTVRIIPQNEYLTNSFEVRLIKWAQSFKK